MKNIKYTGLLVFVIGCGAGAQFNIYADWLNNPVILMILILGGWLIFRVFDLLNSISDK